MRLQEENRLLHERQCTLLVEREVLTGKNAQVRGRMEAIVLCLKAME
jgi:uncharacterized protein (TIGR02449 family)